MTALILASGSPRRRELLAELGARFEVITADVEELTDSGAGGPVAMAAENARLKAEAVAAKAPGRWVLGADTVVALEHRIHRVTRAGAFTLDESHEKVTRVLGKPASLDQAREFLRMLSGQTHEVITACVLIDAKGAHEEFHETTHVTFRDFDDEVIERYLDAVHVLDKAGAYALQEHGDWIVERIEGSRSNVIGLPCEVLKRVLVRRGLL